MATLGQGALISAGRAYRELDAISTTKRPPWETLDQAQQETLALIWFAGFIAGRAHPNSPS